MFGLELVIFSFETARKSQNDNDDTDKHKWPNGQDLFFMFTRSNGGCSDLLLSHNHKKEHKLNKPYTLI